MVQIVDGPPAEFIPVVPVASEPDAAVAVAGIRDLRENATPDPRGVLELNCVAGNRFTPDWVSRIECVECIIECIECNERTARIDMVDDARDAGIVDVTRAGRCEDIINWRGAY